MPTAYQAGHCTACEEIEYRLRTEQWEFGGHPAPLPASPEPQPTPEPVAWGHCSNIKSQITPEQKRTWADDLVADFTIPLYTHPTPQAVVTPTEPDGQHAITLLRSVLDIVQRYLPPDGITEHDAMTEIIGLVDPWPLGVSWEILPEPPAPQAVVTDDQCRQYKAFAQSLRDGDLFSEPINWPHISEQVHMAADTIYALLSHLRRRPAGAVINDEKDAK